MGYLHIENLYKNQKILAFRECYAMEKIHGTSAHIAWTPDNPDPLRFFSGGESHERFVGIFDRAALIEGGTRAALRFPTTIYGEAYGGKQQGMSDTYGATLRFVAFDVKCGDRWLDVPAADALAWSFGIEFVHYVKVATDLAALDAARDRPSVQAKRNGIDGDKPSEGVVLRPIFECSTANGDRIIAKHKRSEFRETKTPRPVSAEQLAVLEEADAIAEEWVTIMRMAHVLDKLGNPKELSETPRVIEAMVEDVTREGEGEFVASPAALRSIRRRAGALYRDVCRTITGP